MKVSLDTTGSLVCCENTIILSLNSFLVNTNFDLAADYSCTFAVAKNFQSMYYTN